MDIPIIVVCYNNYKYVKNTLAQILKINKEYYKNIQILNNSSNCLDTIHYLETVDVKVINNQNNGPWITQTRNSHIYNELPEKYVLTDPDLQFNENIPTNFIDILSELSDQYTCNKIGFALDINNPDKFYQDNNYTEGCSIYNWEKRFWENKINNDNYELYDAGLDTTFCLMNKKFDNKIHIRVGGNFTAKHLPWYIDNEIYNVYENYDSSIKTTHISSIKRIILSDIEKKYLKIEKKNELFLIKNDVNNPNLSFWKDIYSNWENETFEIFDRYLSKDNILIDIGGWIGTTCMYGSRKSKYVYTIEADNKSFEDMTFNLQNNCINNYKLINKAIYNIDNINIKFGKNKFMNNSKMNDSTSQIYCDYEISDDFYLAKTITLDTLIKMYKINPVEIGIIKVDIEGGEEYILNDLFEMYNKYYIPMYISFHYIWWNDKNLDRFNFLTSDVKDKIQNEPFISILFDN